MFFFTVVLEDRSSTLLVDQADRLRYGGAIRRVMVGTLRFAHPTASR
jgi:hypothetical protein